MADISCAALAMRGLLLVASVTPAFGDEPPMVPQVPFFNPLGIPGDPTGVSDSCGNGPHGPSVETAASVNHGQSDTMLLHSGQEVRDEIDLYIPGIDPGVDLVIQRRHTSRRVYGGASASGVFPWDKSTFGDSWSFNYQRRLTKVVENGSLTRLREWGFDRVDEFVRIGSSHRWEATTGRIDTIIWDPNGTAAPRMWRRGGMQLIYSLNFGLQSGARLEIVRSPAGNELHLDYADDDPFDSAFYRITAIKDSYGRDIVFRYQDANRPFSVTEIEDFDGRKVTYTYTGSSASFLSLRQNPAGQKTRYLYGDSTSSDARLKHNLTGIVAPNQENSSQTYTHLSWEYYTQADVTAGAPPWSIGWVKSHTVGNQDSGTPQALRAGGTFNYEYSDVSPAGTPGPNDAVVQIEVNDRRGNDALLKFNALGQMLYEEIQDDLRGNTPASKVRTFEYTADGLLTKAIGAMGDKVEIAYESGERSVEGNQKEHLYTPDSGRAAQTDQTTVKNKVIYEPVFNKPFKIVDPRGVGTANEDQYTTTYVYDYMENLSASITALAPCLGYTTTELTDLLTAAGITTSTFPGPTDVNGDGSTSDTCGNFIKVIHPQVTLPSQATSVLTSTTQNAFELYRYNGYAQLTWHQDAEGNVHERGYFPRTNPHGASLTPDLAITNGWSGGYLAEVVGDTTSASGRNSGVNPNPIGASTLFLYTTNSFNQPLGTSYTRETPTTVIDPRLVRHDFEIDLLDQVTCVTRAAAVQAGSGLTAHAYETKIERDFNNNVVKVRVRDKDNLSGHSGFTNFCWAYDILDNRVEFVEDDANSQHINARVTYVFDASDNLVSETRHEDNANDSSETRWTHDERNLVITETRGYGTLLASTTSNDIDLNGNIVEWIDADPGADGIDDVTQVITDGYDRVVKIIARDGTETVLERDAIGNVIRHTVTGDINQLTSVGGGTSTTTDAKLSETFYGFDTRSRLHQVDEWLAFYMGLGNGGTIDSGDLNTQGGGTGVEDNLVSSVFVRDRLGRTILVADPDADEFIYEYDGLGRVLRTIDPLDNETIYQYDDNGNLTLQKERERSALMSGVVEEFVYNATYDSLNRVVTWQEPNGQKTEYQYDSRDNLKKRIDELGNQVEYRYDRLNRLLEITKYLSTNGLNASSSNLDTSQGGDPSLTGTGAPDGKVTIKSSWDDLHRLKSRTDDRGNVTTYYYDQLDRLGQIDYGDGTTEQWRYNADSEVTLSFDQSGMLCRCLSYDPMGRQLNEVVTPFQGNPTDILGTSIRRWRYDGLGRVWGHSDNNDQNSVTGNDVLVEFKLDTLGRRISESQTIGSLAKLTTDIHWQGANRVIAEDYPNGRRIERTYDALDRLKKVEDATATPSTLIADRDYVGRGRLLRQQYGNGTVLDKRNTAGNSSISGTNPGFDSNGRTVRHEWRDSSSSVVTSYVSTWNGVNRRTSETRGHLGGRTDTYTFDSLYRMVGFSRQGHNGTGVQTWSSTRSLDGVDKMHSFTDEGINRFPQIDQDPGAEGLNQYSQFDLVAGGAADGRVYDDNGGMKDREAGDSQEFRYDHLKRMSRVGDVSGSTFTVSHEYVYDAEGRRVAKLNGSQGLIERYLYDTGWRVIEERDGSGVTRQFVEGAGIDEHLQLRDLTGNSPQDLYYHTNSQGSIGVLTNSSGTVVEQYEYKWLGELVVLDVSGALKSGGSTINNPYFFQGRRSDTETELYHVRHRQYDPATGGFTCIDPSGMWRHGQGNGYSALNADPWNWADPSGLLEEPRMEPFERQVDDNGEGPSHTPGGRRLHSPDERDAWKGRDHLGRARPPSTQQRELEDRGNHQPKGPTPGQLAGAAEWLPGIGDAVGLGRSAYHGDWMGAGLAFLPGRFAETAVDAGRRVGARARKARGNGGGGGTSGGSGSAGGGGATERGGGAGGGGTGGGGAGGSADGPALPPEAWDWKAPLQVAPGCREMEWPRYNPRTNELEWSSVHYDKFGRQVGRTDHTNHGRPSDHDNPHHHRREYGSQNGHGQKTGPHPGPYPGRGVQE